MKNSNFKVSHFCNFLNVEVQLNSIQQDNLCYCEDANGCTYDIELRDLKPLNV